MAWKINLGDRSFLMDDLNEDDLVTIAAAHGTDWLRLYLTPAAAPGALYDLLVLVASKLEVDPPARPERVADTYALLNLLELVDDDLPKAFGDGGLPLGSTEDGQETTGSSISTSPEDGIPTEPEAPLSETEPSS